MSAKENEVVISVQQLDKKYRLGTMGGTTLAEDMKMRWASWRKKPNPLLKINESEQERQAGDLFWALKNINFEVRRGEILGIIGKNGAGKSTLLKLLSQITTPTSGEIKIKGRIASLLEVGTGFHPELTGRENIYLNGAILGMSKAEIDSKISQIISFSGIVSHIDTPVKRYSSGMKVRLGFAVAAHLEPEILVIDEVLAVGDMEFQRKCLGKMNDVASSGRTVLFVSHNMSSVRNLCTSCLVLDKGQIVYSGNTDKAIEHYSNLNDDITVEKKAFVEYPSDTEKTFQFSRIEMEVNDIHKPAVFEFKNPVKMKINIIKNKMIPDYCFLGIVLKDTSDNILAVFCDDDEKESVLRNLETGKYSVNFSIPGEILKPGIYHLTFSLRTPADDPFDKYEKALSFEITDTITWRGQKKNYRSAVAIAPLGKWSVDKINEL